MLLLPTGYGKSLCYFSAAGVLEGLTVVVCPLIALVDDQHMQASSGGLQACKLHSGMHERDQRRSLARIWSSARAPLASHQRASRAFATVAHCQDELASTSDPAADTDPALASVLDVLVVTPERLLGSKALRAALCALHRRRLLARIVVDEAHVLSRWGTDFRPALLMMGQIRVHWPDVPIIAASATATPSVAREIQDCLQLGADGRRTRVAASASARRNLHLSVQLRVSSPRDLPS